MGGALQNLGVSAAINLGAGGLFVAAYMVASRFPINMRVYFSALSERDPDKFAHTGKKGLASLKPDFHIFDWLKDVLRMSEEELISIAGLDAVLLLRIIALCLRMFVPITLWALVVLIPVNATDHNVDYQLAVNPKSSFDTLDKISLSNVRDKSTRMWAHLVSSYLFAFWAYYCLWTEYAAITRLRLKYMADGAPHPEDFTVLATEIPPAHSDNRGSTRERVERFFREQFGEYFSGTNTVTNAESLWRLIKKRDDTANKLDAKRIKAARKSDKRRLTTRTGCLGLCGPKVDAIGHYEKLLEKHTDETVQEARAMEQSEDRYLNAAFVTFTNRWAAAIAAQTQLATNPLVWVTEMAPEPRDVQWSNLGVSKWQKSIRRIIISTAVFFLVFFYLIPVGIVQSLANLNSVRSIGTPVRQIVDVPFISGLISGFLPGVVLKLFLWILPALLKAMSTFEGYSSNSRIIKETCIKMYYFQLVNVFFGSILTGSLFQQLRSFINKPTSLPQTLGNAIPSKSSFFITYIMLDGWAGFPAELLRLWALIIYHIKVALLVTTEKDREKAMGLSGLAYEEILPSLLFYILLGLVYAPIAPILLPFLLLFFVLGYVVYKNQIINVYEREFESAAGLWPFVASRIITALMVAQLTLLGVLSLKLATKVAPFAIPLPIMTALFGRVLKERFEANFVNSPLESAKAKDAADTTRFPDWKLEEATRAAYTHPAITGGLEQDFLAEMIKGEVHGDLEGGPDASVRTPPTSEMEKPVQMSGMRARAAPHSVETAADSIATGNDSQLSAEDNV
ncbi:early-responsive to dehydration stress-related protein [Klebsormidium nitens]|uniref:Early-responsive to dehydration stress-related protein n=1 Tax=Klebsormidium nitens TaxID=105231 RepID=A0A1Y1HV89_KLENI|nr:early-responsive to dehydration stress-related protein [Klebsormidium nitens]|eukprot:GAQ81109.1 early-responsive to dehydration stress-related protein [Klebsormidium nitens]